jgi:hypothetical protein
MRVTLRVARWRALRPPLWRPARWLLPVRRAMRRLHRWLALRWLGVRALSVRWLSLWPLPLRPLPLRWRRWRSLARRGRRGASTGLGRRSRSAG